MEKIELAELLNESVDVRVESAINRALAIYLSRLKTGFIKAGLEASFQGNLAAILRDILQLLTFHKDERFLVYLEEKFTLDGKDNYVDICVEYRKNETSQKYLIELKFKKKAQGAQNNGVYECFKDIHNLELLKDKNAGYFVFLTDYEGYSKKPTKDDGVRQNFPMYQGAKIEKTIDKDKHQDAKIEKKLHKYKHYKEFKFCNDYAINYKNMQSNEGENFWYFLLKIT